MYKLAVESYSVEDRTVPISNFLESRIHQAFTVAADQLYALGFINQEERIAISSCIGDALEAFSDVMQEKVPSASEIEVPLDVAKEILRNAILHRRQRIVRLAREEELGIPISSEYLDLPDRDQDHSTLRLLIEQALVDEMNAQQHYDNMLEVLEQMDLPVDMDSPNREAVEEIFGDEKDHEKILLRMLDQSVPQGEPQLAIRLSGRHAFDKCMDCDKPPEYEMMWADGRAHAWFCEPHLKEFISEDLDRKNGSDIPWIKEIMNGEAFKNPTKNTNPNVKGKFTKRASLPNTEEAAFLKRVARLSKVSDEGILSEEDEAVLMEAIDEGFLTPEGDLTAEERLYTYGVGAAHHLILAFFQAKSEIEAAGLDDGIKNWLEAIQSAVNDGEVSPAVLQGFRDGLPEGYHPGEYAFAVDNPSKARPLHPFLDVADKKSALPDTEEAFYEVLIAATERFLFDPNSTQNEGRWRLIDPKVFDQGSIRRWNIWKELNTPGVQFVMGKDTRDNEWKPQAIRFDKVDEQSNPLWTEEKAAAWWEKNKQHFTKEWAQTDWDEWMRKRPSEVFPGYTKSAALFNEQELRQYAEELRTGVVPKTLAVDFDGTIFEYDGFKGVGVFGPPINGAKEILKQFKDDGWYIIIDTCRGEVPLIIEQLTLCGIPFDEVNSNRFQPDTANPGKPLADYRIDDSAIHFGGDWAAVYEEVYQREKGKEYSPLQAVKVTANSGGAFAYDPQRGILLDFLDPFGHRTQPQDYPDPPKWGYPKSLIKKQKEKQKEKEEAAEDIRPTGSVLDYPRNSLDPAIWEYEEGADVPKLRPEVKKTITREFEEWADLIGIYADPEEWIKEYLFVGSSATTQWKETSDIDITVVMDEDVVVGAGIVPSDVVSSDYIASWLGIQVSLGLNGYEIAQHPVNYWIASDERPIDMADAIYNLGTDTWIKPPPEVPREFDPEEVFEDVWKEARDWANKFDIELSETRRDINDYVDLHEYRGREKDLVWVDTKLRAKRAEIAQDIRSIVNNFKDVYERKELAFATPAYAEPEGRLYFSRNWSPAVLIWKWFEKYDYLKLLKDVMKIYKDEPEDTITEEKVWKLREVLS